MDFTDYIAHHRSTAVHALRLSKMTSLWLLTRKSRLRRQAARHIASSRFAEADDLLGIAIGRWPDDLGFRFQSATCAHNAGRYADALLRWDYIRSRWPHCAMAWSGSAANSRELGKVWRARDIIDEAVGRFPTDVIALSEAMRIYDRLGQTTRSLQLSAETIRLRPRYPPAWTEHFARLLNTAQIREAAALLERAPKHFAADLALFRARVALRERNWAEAEDLIELFLIPRSLDKAEKVHQTSLHAKTLYPHESLFLHRRLLKDEPANRLYLHHFADAQIRCGNYDEAAAIARSALQLFKDDFDLAFDLAHAALKTGSFDEAAESFDRLVLRDPHHLEAKHLLALSRMERAYADGGDGLLGTSFAQRQNVGLVDDEETRLLLLKFESLGQDCEFGLLQRHFGAEPLGLFRWNFIRPDRLREAFAIGLAGIGEPEHTLISLWPNQEYKISDARWGFAFHTWITAHESGEDELYRKMCLRLRFLRRKMLDELASGEKVFVLKTYDTSVEEVRQLFGTLTQLGPARLLWVRSLEVEPASGLGRQGGTVAQIEPGLFAGFVSSFGNGLGDVWKIAYDEWISLCRIVASLGMPNPIAPSQAE